MERKRWKRQLRPRHAYEDHDHEARQGRALQKRLTIHFETTHDPISGLVFSLRSKRRFGKARLEASHWVMRTSFETQSVFNQFPVFQIFVPQLYTRLPCCTHPAHDTPFQRDTCDRSMCKGSDRHQRFFSTPVVLVSIAGQCGSVSRSLVGTFACSESSSLIS